jgi:O-acetylhomoserine/O-acetylserine sulfhydrylase-like pyridoxal-dependent enzyme
LDVRMEKHNKNAMAVAKFLESHPRYKFFSFVEY